MCKLYNLFVEWQNMDKNDVKVNNEKFENCKTHLLNLTISGQKKTSENKVIRQEVKDFFTVAKTTASTTSFDVLIKYPSTKNVILAWDQLEKDISSLTTIIFKDLSLHSLLLSVEVHREKKVLKVSTIKAFAVPDQVSKLQAELVIKGGKPDTSPCKFKVNNQRLFTLGVLETVTDISKLDTVVLATISKKGSTKENIFEENINWRLRGKPHIHLCVTFYKNILVSTNSVCNLSCVDQETLKSLLEKNINGQVTINLLDTCDNLKDCLNITEHFIKCIQDISDVKTQKFLKNYTTLRSSCTLFSGHSDSVSLCRNLVLKINKLKSNSEVLFKRLNTFNVNKPPFIAK